MASDTDKLVAAQLASALIINGEPGKPSPKTAVAKYVQILEELTHQAPQPDDDSAKPEQKIDRRY